MRIARVFPRRTKATPDDEMAFVGMPPSLFPPECDEVHISVSFTWDIPFAERLAKEWTCIAPVKMGGPALGTKGEEFEPGKYVKPGYVITSRGCPNKCWFCSVWKRDGNIRELTIRDGWNVLDDNLLACGEAHIRRVFDMLSKYGRKVEFTGGLEAKRLQPWQAEKIASINPKGAFFAYDTPDDLAPLRLAGRLLSEAGLTNRGHTLRCYVLCGWPKDTMENAEKRMMETVDAGFFPMAMLYRDHQGKTEYAWRKFQRTWARPAIIHRIITNQFAGKA